MAQRISEGKRRLLLTELRNAQGQSGVPARVREMAQAYGLSDLDLDRIATAHGLTPVAESGYHAQSVGSSGRVLPQLAVRDDQAIHKARLKTQVEAHGIRFLDRLERPTDNACLQWSDQVDANLWSDGERPNLWSALDGPLKGLEHRFEKYKYPPGWIDNVVLSNGGELGWLEHEALVERYGDAIRNQAVPNVSIRPAGEAGHGVFAEADIPAGTFLGEYLGVVKIPTDADIRDLAKRHHAHSAGRLAFDPTEDEYAIGYHPAPDVSPVPFSTIDAAEAGNHTRFVNHDSNPNADVGYVFLDGSWHAILVANQDIPKGSQLSFDYGDSYWNLRGITPQPLE